ncbi:hypothetical protein CC78DRAFT_543382 [Lojkania enalia]|uniref:Uncharacterized protein n=1 Tax=Lojkania enalia TaxID=147567 RepID=A0A9P4KB72_9PLEO|nr:hypothetical protein CC78DRAFT_543382 [Didymosphaeria enalia]
MLRWQRIWQATGCDSRASSDCGERGLRVNQTAATRPAPGRGLDVAWTWCQALSRSVFAREEPFAPAPHLHEPSVMAFYPAKCAPLARLRGHRRPSTPRRQLSPPLLSLPFPPLLHARRPVRSFCPTTLNKSAAPVAPPPRFASLIPPVVPFYPPVNGFPSPAMGLLDLSNELLREILDHIDSDPEKLVTLDRRAYLSQESFKPPQQLDPYQAQTIASFRLTCKRFSDLGAIHQFSRVTTRFSRKGLERLENIAGQEHLAKHVKKFSYMVPFFYVDGRERVRELLPTLSESLGSLDVRHFVQKIEDQKKIVQNKEDVRVLNKAISAFTSLQHVQILRLQDQEDGMLISYIRRHEELNQLVELKWPPACSHSAKTIGAALLASRSPCTRFSSPMLSPQSAMALAANDPPNTFSLLAERLTCLELHFDDGTDLDDRMRELSPLAKVVFNAAKNMQAVHIGFPSHRPLSLKLEEIFHNVKWDKLLAFGIQAWRLDADEIIGLARRHRERLRGLRLRDVLLKEGSRWKDVLAFLRNDMMRLDWVSLRRIDYEKHFDEQLVMGAEVPDDHPIGSSDDESDDWDRDQNDELDDNIIQDNLYDGESDGSLDDSDSDFGTDEPEQGGNMDFPPLSPDTPASVPWCNNCNGRMGHLDSTEGLGDDGIAVTYPQRKLWEKWVVRRSCNEHSHK